MFIEGETLTKESTGSRRRRRAAKGQENEAYEGEAGEGGDAPLKIEDLAKTPKSRKMKKKSKIVSLEFELFMVFNHC